VDALVFERRRDRLACASTCWQTRRTRVYYFYEAYRDEAATEAHRAAPHYAFGARRRGPLDGARGYALPDRLFRQQPTTDLQVYDAPIERLTVAWEG